MVGSPYWMAPEMMLGKLTFYFNLLEQKRLGFTFFHFELLIERSGFKLWLGQ